MGGGGGWRVAAFVVQWRPIPACWGYDVGGGGVMMSGSRNVANTAAHWGGCSPTDHTGRGGGGGLLLEIGCEVKLKVKEKRKV